MDTVFHYDKLWENRIENICKLLENLQVLGVINDLESGLKMIFSEKNSVEATTNLVDFSNY
jgi:hypothetical protein